MKQSSIEFAVTSLEKLIPMTSLLEQVQQSNAQGGD
jgi:hypothetical protein